VVPAGSERPIDDRNERSLPYRFKLRNLDENLHQETWLTIQGRVNEEIYIWDYTVDEFIKGIEEGGFVSRNSGSVQGTGFAEHIGRSTLQRIMCGLRNEAIRQNKWFGMSRFHLKNINYLEQKPTMSTGIYGSNDK